MYKRVIENFDKKIHKYISNKSDKNYNVELIDYFNNRPTNNKEYNYLLNNIREIYSNTASMLTHISAMIAVMGILLILFQDNPITTFVVFIEMIIYSIFAAICIYCIRWNQPENAREVEIKNDPLKSCYNRYKRHKYIYSLCADGVFYTTILFIITLISHLIGDLILK